MTKQTDNFGVNTKAKRLYTETSGMTEKRFTYKHFDWLQWHIYKDNEFFIEVTNCEEDAKNLCDLLNAQHEEIQSLKLELELSKPLFSRRQLEEENRKLKEQLRNLRRLVNEAYLEGSE